MRSLNNVKINEYENNLSVLEFKISILFKQLRSLNNN